MTRGARRGVALALALLAGPRAAEAQRVIVEGPAGNPITAAAGRFRVRAEGFSAADLPLQLRLQVGTSPSFDDGLVADTTVPTSDMVIVLPRLLPEGALLYWRATALTARGGAIPSEVTGPRTAPRHLTLLSPNAPAGQSLTTRRPTFSWRSSSVPAPLAAWDYELRVEQAPLGTPVIIARTADTSFSAFTDLEANTSYRWRVLARFPASGEQVEVASAGSFVIRSDDAPLATLLYQNFPNPFPSPTADRTCLWFDLRTAGPVALDVLDLRGQPVKRVVPSARVRSPLPAGRYGRPSAGASSGCDPDFTWDGTADDGRHVPPGVYLVRLRADGTETLRRIVFRGR